MLRGRVVQPSPCTHRVDQVRAIKRPQDSELIREHVHAMLAFFHDLCREQACDRGREMGWEVVRCYFDS